MNGLNANADVEVRGRPGMTLAATQQGRAEQLRALLAVKKRDTVQSVNAYMDRQIAENRAMRSARNWQPVHPEHRAAVATPEYRSAFDEYLRVGTEQLSPSTRRTLQAGEHRDLSDSTGASGGYTVSNSWARRFTAAQQFASPVRSLATVIETTDTRALQWPSTDDTGNAAVALAENVPVSEVDPTFSRLNLKAWAYVAMIRVPRSLEADVRNVFTDGGTTKPNSATATAYEAVSIGDIITSLGAPRMARGQNPGFTSGSGAGTMLGVTHATSGATSAAPTTVSYADLQAVWASLDPAYRPTATWMFNASTEKAIRALVDAGNRLLFDPAKPLTLFGAPVVLNRDLPNLASTSVSIIVGDFARGYVVRTAGLTVQRLSERFMDNIESGYVIAERVDGVLDDLAALRALTQHV